MRAVWRALAALGGVVVLAFALTRLLAGDPVAMLGAVPGMAPDDLAQLRVAAGLDRPVAMQFFDYVRGLLVGDMGHSVSTGLPVAQEIARRLPASLELALAGFGIALAVVMALGLAIARAPGGLVDRFARGLVALGAALPLFVTGLLLIQLVYVHAGAGFLPVGRLPALLTPPTPRSGLLLLDALLAGDRHVLAAAAMQLLLPAAVVAIFAVAPMLRVFRAALLAALSDPGVSGARALGFSERVVLTRYALPEALGPLIPVALLTFGYILGAAVLVEKVFAWPGIGRYALEALAALDFPPVQGVMLALAAIHVGLALLADLLGRRLDPRIGGMDG